ncbi:MAG: type II toxin-antitoxin system HicA family toxin [Campylobacterota bacterium]|nr:type II toxin-antitoxin system HicA family toxin [Campylobacterota bacterium]
MSKKDKLLEAIKNNPKNVRFEDLKKILESIGYKAINRGGSHYVFTKANATSLTIPFKKPVKVVYVKQVLNIIEQEEA